jgi:hypothetical protein
VSRGVRYGFAPLKSSALNAFQGTAAGTRPAGPRPAAHTLA